VLLGDASVVDHATFSADYRQYFLSAPIEALSRYSGTKDDRRATSFARRTAHLRGGNIATAALIGFAPLVSELLIDRDLLKLSPIKMRRCQDAFLDILARTLTEQGNVVGMLPTEGIGLRHVREAEEFMQSHCHQPIGISDVAAHVGISTRALQLAFRRELDTTPLRRLQHFRLVALHSALVEAHHGDWRLIAAQWGFVNQSRLARQYAALFAETPSETVRRLHAKRAK
jgi:AraC-like DNA-binding protein